MGIIGRTTRDSQAKILPKPVGFRADVKNMTPEEFQEHRRQMSQRYRDTMSHQKKIEMRARDRIRKQEDRDMKKKVKTTVWWYSGIALPPDCCYMYIL